ncbi:hypothetical protein [Herbidospora sp. NBRC 101105]|uniref:hypothetical protein n=1 Tax=Herbidospora sp. NBRC 101105 TaxID=3032195 RepID=UPI002555320A|nr:hypothetical protein [Herbidospora sp. NBRC 101105]
MPVDGTSSRLGSPVTMLREYRIALPDESRGRLLAAELVDRGHRWVRLRPVYLPHLDLANPFFGEPGFSRPELEGWWHVTSVVDELVPDDDMEDHQLECEEVAVAAVARRHQGFCDGGSMADRETLLRHLDLRGLLHDQTQEQAYRRRAAIARSFPARRVVPPPLVAAAAPVEGGLPPLLDTVRVAASRLHADGTATPVTDWWLTGEPEHYEDDQELLSGLFDAVLHQGTCSPHTAEQVPLLAGIVGHDQVAAPYRAFLLFLLAEAGTVGRRLAARDADRRSALGLGFGQNAEETTAQNAVAAVAPALLRRWPEECEAVRCGLAFLAAGFPDSARAAGVIEPIAEMAAACAERHRAAMMRLAHALASADGEALRARYSEAIAGTPVRLTGIPSPVAPATAAGLHILHLMLESETDLILQAGA